jgi:hypothetical protein
MSKIPMIRTKSVVQLIQQAQYMLVELDVLQDEYPDDVVMMPVERDKLQDVMYTFRELSALLENSS